MTDDDLATDTQALSITIDSAPSGSGDMGVFDISWNSKKKNLEFTVNIRQDSDASGTLTMGDSSVAAASVRATLCHIDSSTCWTNFGGDTDAKGNITFKLVGGAPIGLYEAEVTGLTHNPSPPAWHRALDVDNPEPLPGSQEERIDKNGAGLSWPLSFY